MTEAGEYKIRVTAVPEDEDNFLKSNSVEVTYTVKSGEPSSEPDGNSGTSDGGSGEESKNTGCGGAVGVTGVFAALLAVGAVTVCRKRKENE